METLHGLTIKKFHEGLQARKFSAEEITKGYLTYSEAKDKEIDAYLSIRNEQALAEARDVDVSLAAGKDLSPMAGVPMAIKDNMVMRGEVTTAASKILAEYRGAYDGTVVGRLKDAQAVLLGKTNLDEFAMGSSTENSAFQVTKNPRDTSCVPGGSSGGSAAAVAANMALAALGSDTGGSIRQPAGFCDIVGLKPTYGAVSRYGLIAMASSLDQIGPFTKTVEDAAILFESIAGKDPLDSTSSDPQSGYEQLSKLDEARAKSLVVGIPEEYFGSGLSPEVQAAMDNVIKVFDDLGVKTKPINLPHTKYALSVYYIIMPAEVSANLARFDGIRYGTRHASKEGAANLIDLYKKNRSIGFGDEVKRRIILGTFVLSSGHYDAYYAKAQKVRSLIKQDFDHAFDPNGDEVDVILAPTSPTLPFKFGERTADPLQMYLADVLTIPVNLAGIPAISIPAWSAETKLPVGFQLMGKHWGEKDILQLGMLYEKSVR